MVNNKGYIYIIIIIILMFSFSLSEQISLHHNQLIQLSSFSKHLKMSFERYGSLKDIKKPLKDA